MRLTRPRPGVWKASFLGCPSTGNWRALQAGADTSAADETGARPIEAAAEAGAREVVETLLPLTQPPAGAVFP